MKAVMSSAVVVLTAAAHAVCLFTTRISSVEFINSQSLELYFGHIRFSPICENISFSNCAVHVFEWQYVL